MQGGRFCHQVIIHIETIRIKERRKKMELIEVGHAKLAVKRGQIKHNPLARPSLPYRAM